jgi:NAD(P)-dependent dehydrogenase (short-subunit alcohol dehydrogenase family)
MSTANLEKLLSFKDKSVMVTGGCQNFGWEIATGFAELGANIAVTSRNGSKAEKAAAELASKHDVKVIGIALDITDEKSVADAFDKAMAEFGSLDALVNNAGGHSPLATGKLDTEPLEAWNVFMNINMTGTFLMTREYARHMMQQGKGAIVNIASVAGVVGRDRRVYPEGMKAQPVQYAAAKAGMIGLTYDSAAYLADYGIRVNAVSPGGFERGQPEKFIEEYSDRVMLKRMGRDGYDLKGAVTFLASDAAAYITGHNMLVDGGFTKYK